MGRGLGSEQSRLRSHSNTSLPKYTASVSSLFSENPEELTLSRPLKPEVVSILFLLEIGDRGLGQSDISSAANFAASLIDGAASSFLRCIFEVWQQRFGANQSASVSRLSRVRLEQYDFNTARFSEYGLFF